MSTHQPDANAITTRGLVRRFGKITAVDHLNIKISSGSLYGLIGPNGAGKTTTLRMLAGLLEPTEGEIRIHELTFRQYWNEIQWQIGFMPDFFGVYEDLLTWEYLDFFARCYKLAPTRRKQVVNELLELVGLTDKRDAFVHTLSRGMTQRLCLAHALVHDPQVLLLDEPASGLDPRARVEMRELLRELRAMGKTIVLSSHILSELAELCDAVGIMEHGRLVASGPLEEIHKRIQADRIFQIRILKDMQRAQNLLSNFPGVNKIATADEDTSFVEIHFTGDDSAAADLLTTLVSQGVRVASFSEAATDLEEVFLHLTQAEVAP